MVTVATVCERSRPRISRLIANAKRRDIGNELLCFLTYRPVIADADARAKVRGILGS